MQTRDEIFSIESAASSGGNFNDSRMWYVRLRIRDDRLAKLWAWKLAEHDVIVWSDAEERWKQLLAVPELRAAVRRATTSAYARQKATSEPPPGTTAARGEQKGLLDLDLDASPTHVYRTIEQATLLDDVDEPTSVRPRWSSTPASATVDPLLRALTTSIPPAVHTNPAPDIPKAPKLPSFGEMAARLESEVVALPLEYRMGVAGSLRQRWLRALVHAVSRLPTKSIGWATLPVVGAAVFAIVLFKSPEPKQVRLPGNRSEDNALAEWGIEDQQITERLAAKLVGAAPICAGQAPTRESPIIQSPDQLVLLTKETRRTAAPAGRATKQALPVRRKSSDMGQPPLATGKASAVAMGPESERNDFDRDAARTALRFAMARARNCSNSGISGSVLITFGTSGTVQSAQIGQLVGDDVDPSCVSRAFSASRIPPFTGNAVTVRKSF